jgi:hypothetical protein
LGKSLPTGSEEMGRKPFLLVRVYSLKPNRERGLK